MPKNKHQKKKINFTPHGPATEEELHLYDEAVFAWTAPEYIQHAKSKLWYAVEAAAAALLLIYAVLSGNYTMALALLVLAAVYHYLHEKHPPKNIKIVVSNMGIKVGAMIFPYDHVQAFWMMYHPPYLKTLNLRIRKHFFSDVVIQLADMNPASVRHFLCGQIPELEGKTEQFGDTLIRLLKL